MRTLTASLSVIGLFLTSFFAPVYAELDTSSITAALTTAEGSVSTVGAAIIALFVILAVIGIVISLLRRG
jgi:high-affinity Fe2+/Pb2+ permease